MTAGLSCLWVIFGRVAARAQDAPPGGENNTGPGPAPMTDIHGIKPALPMGSDLSGWLWAAAAVALIAAVALLCWWLWRRRKPAVAAPDAALLPPAEVEAYAHLDGLAAGDHTDLKLFYFRLSAILRRYMERRYDIPAAEMTTEELLPRLGRMAMAADMVQQLKAFCLRADPIKFAGVAADEQRLAHELAFGRDFVRRTTPAHMPGAGVGSPVPPSNGEERRQRAYEGMPGP
jgi:hypothetical protein